MFGQLLAELETRVPNLTASDFVILAAAWMRVYLDGEELEAVSLWARNELGLVVTLEEILRLNAKGASIREISRKTGLSKSSVHRLLSSPSTEELSA